MKGVMKRLGLSVRVPQFGMGGYWIDEENSGKGIETVKINGISMSEYVDRNPIYG